MKHNVDFILQGDSILL